MKKELEKLLKWKDEYEGFNIVYGKDDADNNTLLFEGDFDLPNFFTDMYLDVEITDGDEESGTLVIGSKFECAITKKTYYFEAVCIEFEVEDDEVFVEAISTDQMYTLFYDIAEDYVNTNFNQELFKSREINFCLESFVENLIDEASYEFIDAIQEVSTDQLCRKLNL